MTEQSPFAIGTVAQEAARLIEDMATMARSSYNRADDPSGNAGGPAPEPRSGSAPDAPDAPDGPDAQPGVHPGRPHGEHEARDRGPRDQPVGGHEAGDGSPTGVCSVCGADSDEQRRADDTPASCRICPLCRGIAVLRSVRPETVDLLADLALSVAAGLRDVASRSRASAPPSPSPSSPGPGGPADGDRTTVQDIHVDDESE